MGSTNHMRQFFDAELEDLKNRLLEMGGLVASSVHRSVLALTEMNEDVAHQVLRDESRIDTMEIQIDDLATKLIATQQPVARDMRFIVVAIKINTELERMGDLAAAITERSLSAMHQPRFDGAIYRKMQELASVVEHMVLSVLDAFVKQDPEAARNIIVADDSVDRLRTALSDELVELMKRDTTIIPRALSLIFNARSLERISDHATNIAEEVIFLSKGIDVRHRFAAERAAEASATPEEAPR